MSEKGSGFLGLAKKQWDILLKRHYAGEKTYALAIEHGIDPIRLIATLQELDGLPSIDAEPLGKGVLIFDTPPAPLEDYQTSAVRSLDISQSHHKNLTWALSAAGRFMRTGEVPMECPNDAAFYLYKQAVADPNSFLAKLTQLEVRQGQDEKSSVGVPKSVLEIEKMLSALEAAEDAGVQT